MSADGTGGGSAASGQGLPDAGGAGGAGAAGGGATGTGRPNFAGANGEADASAGGAPSDTQTGDAVAFTDAAPARDAARPTEGAAPGSDASISGGAAMDGAAADACPNDPQKTQPGACGCGATEACAPLKQAMIHRYAFGGSGAVAEDTIGTADGRVVGSTLTGSGSVVLNGSDQFVDLPNGLISTLQSATFELWATVAAGIGTYSHLLDFGSSTGAEGSQGTGRSFLFLAPGSNASDVMRAAISLSGPAGERMVDSAFIPVGVLTHVAVVFDDAADTMRLYRDGSLMGMVTATIQLNMIVDVNNWLGRSQFSVDADFKGSIDEFRIYNTALSAADVSLSAMLGPNPDFLNR